MEEKMMTRQFRFKLDPSTPDEAGHFTGYASVFGVVDSYGDIVDKGAFKKTIKEHKRFKLLWSHNAQEPGIGYVELEEDEKGLYVREGQLYLDIQRGREAYINMKNGTLDGLSIGYNTIKETIDRATNERHLKEISLWEVSLCNFQACPGAVVDEVKSALELKPYPNEHAARLQDPDKFDRFRRKADGTLYNKIKVPETIDVIWGHVKDGDDDDWAAQALRFPTKDWTAAEAKAWLKENEIKYIDFEPASKSLENAIEIIWEHPGFTDTEKTNLIKTIESHLALHGHPEPPAGTRRAGEPPSDSGIDEAIVEAVKDLGAFTLRTLILT